MKGTYLRTSDIARVVGVHPNTVRLYETWGFLPPVLRSPSGYRLFNEDHLDQMRLARAALAEPWPGRKIRGAAVALVRQAASGDLPGALERANSYLALVQIERAQAEAAAQFLERWAQGAVPDVATRPLRVSEAAKLLAVTTDTLRGWERNGLVKVARDSVNGYRLYGAAEVGRLRVVRLLRQAGYSTMAILRMFLRLDQGQRQDLRQILDTPRPDEDAIYAADRWLSTLAVHEGRARELIAQLGELIRKRRKRGLEGPA
jgi:DNA-binding transcriptional MerR regulator